MSDIIVSISIVDILFAIATLLFSLAGIVQLRKIIMTKKTDGISLKHYQLKFIAHTCMLSGYIMLNYIVSIIIVIFDTSVTISIIVLVLSIRNKIKRGVEHVLQKEY